MEIAAIIVARKGSVRIKNKSMSILGGETLIARKIRQLKKVDLVDRIIVGSNSDEILHEATIHGAEAVRRDDFFCDEKRASANDMLYNMAEMIQTDLIVWTHCTNPFLSSGTYSLAIQTYLNNVPNFDSLLSVRCLQEHLWGPTKKPLNYDPYSSRHTPARELPKYYMQDGGIFIQPREAMLSNRYFFGSSPFLYEIPEIEFCDINNEYDLKMARARLMLETGILGNP